MRANQVLFLVLLGVSAIGMIQAEQADVTAQEKQNNATLQTENDSGNQQTGVNSTSSSNNSSSSSNSTDSTSSLQQKEQTSTIESQAEQKQEQSKDDQSIQDTDKQLSQDSSTSNSTESESEETEPNTELQQNQSQNQTLSSDNQNKTTVVPFGDEDGYEQFSFDALFSDYYDYFGYDYFQVGYDYQDIDKENKTSTKSSDRQSQYQDYMYDNLYGDYYEDYFYEDQEYTDYEYYGDYGYYGIYDQEGYFYGNTNGGSSPDTYDYEYDYFKFNEDVCETNQKGETVVNSSIAVCDLKIEGADSVISELDGGLDGLYKLAGCLNGRPKYIRYEPKRQERILWWSNMFGDWDISTGTEPNEDDILIYGGDGLDEERPNFVFSWNLAVDVMSKEKQSKEQDDYITIDLKVTCADGKTLDRPEHSIMGKQPLLTHEEMESQYRMIYQKYGRKQPPSPEINFALVVGMVFVGMGVVLGIPYMMVRKGSKGWQNHIKIKRIAQQRKKRVGKD